MNNFDFIGVINLRAQYWCVLVLDDSCDVIKVYDRWGESGPTMAAQRAEEHQTSRAAAGELPAEGQPSDTLMGRLKTMMEEV